MISLSIIRVPSLCYGFLGCYNPLLGFSLASCMVFATCSIPSGRVCTDEYDLHYSVDYGKNISTNMNKLYAYSVASSPPVVYFLVPAK